MESVARSRQPNKASVMLSNKITNGSSNGVKTLYDDVYGGPPKFAAASSISPRFEDYGEIFASFHAARASSIPVLDLPAVDGGDVLSDFRTAFDYAEVFGGFDGLDFWSSHEDLFRNGLSEEEEEEAWTPVETDSFSGDLDHFGNNQHVLNSDVFQSVDRSTEFNVSYHKVNGTSNGDMSKGKTHVTQLHAVPGFTHVFDETARFHRADPALQVVDDIDLDVEFNAGREKRNHLRKTMSHPSNFTSGEQILGSDLDLHDGCSRNASHSAEMFITVSDISLRTRPSQLPPPSRPPPVLDAGKEYTSEAERVDSEEALGDSSPPFFDVEVDINSSSAAMEEALHKPEAKLKSAKELKERKKGFFESNVKSNYDVKTNEAKMSEKITRFNSLNDERMQATCDRRSGKTKISAKSQKAWKAAPETLEPLEGERVLNMFEEKHFKESRSSQESDRSTGVGTWKEATDFFELVGTEESGETILPINHTKSLGQDTRSYERDRKGETSNIQEEYKNVKAFVESYQLEEYKKKSKAAKGSYEQDKNIRRSKSSNEKCRQREHVKNDKMTEIFELEKSEKKTQMVHQHGRTNKKVTKADESGCLKDMAETQHKELKQEESEKSKEVDRQTLSEVQGSMKLKENEKKLKEDEEQQLSVKRKKQSQIRKENGKIQKEAFALGAAEGEKRVKDSEELEKIDERLNKAFKLDRPEENVTCKRESEIILKQAKQIQNKKGLKEVCGSELMEKSQKGSFKKEESDEGLKHAFGLVENEKGLKGDFEPEMNEKRTKKAFDQGVNEAWGRDQGKEKCKEVCDGYGKEEEAGDNKGIQKVQKQAPELERNSGNEAQRKNETESPPNQAFDREGSVDISNEDSHSEQSEKILKDARNEKDKALDKALEQMEGIGECINMKFAKKTNETWETECDENLLAAHSSSIHEENIAVSQEPIADQEIGKERTDSKVGQKEMEEVGVENLIANGKKTASEMSPGEAEHSGTQSGKVDSSVTNVDELCFSSEQTCTGKTKTVPKMEFDPKSHQEIAHEWGERGEIKQHVNAAINHEESRDQKSSSQANLCSDNRRNTVTDEPATVQEVVNVQNTSQRSHVAHSIKSKEKNLNENLASVEKDAERVRRERELEKDRLRKIEEEIERERERQKDRLAVDRAMLEAEREREREKDRRAVDRATFEARDRAYAEARERAERAAFERATAEARQRALAEARERLEKACADATRDKTYSDKAAVEARLKAERAAVERATAEARERAMEKVKVERAAFESRERLERSVSDKFGVSFRNDGRQGSSSSDMLDPHFQNFSSSTGSRYPYSSVYGASSFNERSEGEGESAQRCRARLERYRRTAERAAKALEEKNMRDLLTQREQAERNRLAETLDAEVRRWSSGKEGNLRALLSTLQYILGPDSGWQPIPLTEVITSAAVKKAYRKATLCVHPDKLQQRGASIQHKYVCEKVFDLLKEAWNKFNSEER